MGSAVLAHVHQRFLHNAHQFPAGSWRKRNFLQLRDEAHIDAGVSGKTFYEFGHKVKQLMRSDIDRAHALHQLAQVQNLLAQQALNALKFVGLRAIGAAPAQNIHLHLDTDERLDRGVMQLASDPGPLGRAGSRAERAKQIHRIQDRR